MLTLTIETALKLTDDNSLNTSEGMIATVFDDPNKLAVNYTEWFSARIDTLGSFKSITWTPHFTPQFMLLEMNQNVDISINTPASVRYITPQYGFGSVTALDPTILTHASPVFVNVAVDDILSVLSGDHAIIGDYTVVNVISPYQIEVSAPMYGGVVGVALDFVFRVSRSIPASVVMLPCVNKLCKLFMPLTSVTITNVSLFNVAVRSLFLG